MSQLFRHYDLNEMTCEMDHNGAKLFMKSNLNFMRLQLDDIFFELLRHEMLKF